MGRHYVPLPKLNGQQVATVTLRLQELGFRTRGTEQIRAERAGTSLTLDSRGVCRSNRDLTDILAPVIPEILAMRKEHVSSEALRGRYFLSRRAGTLTRLRLMPRMESSSLWSLLRGAGLCALTPDEQMVYSRVISRSSMESECLADYPTDGCAVKIIGRRQYYSCRGDEKEIAANLRSTDTAHPRNTYLPRDSGLLLSALRKPGNTLRPVLDDLGEWCYFTSR